MAAAVAVMCLASCTKKMDMVYFTNVDEAQVMQLAKDNAPRIQVDDELKITVYSQAPQATAVFNLPAISALDGSDTEVSSLQKLQTYRVDTQGYINFPVLGQIHAEGMTIDELKSFLTEKVGETVLDPVVNVEFTNFRVLVLGDVNEPGAIEVKRQTYTLLDALADAKDIADTGRRDNVMLLRREGDKMVSHRFDIRDANIMSSPYFMLRQNDVVYVEPNDVKKSNSSVDTDRSYRLQVVSAVISAVSIATSLLIALVVRK